MHTPREICTETRERCQRDHLEGQASNHDVYTSLPRAAVARTSHSASSGLKQQGDEVKGDEDDGICTGLESCKIPAVSVDQPGEAKVDASGEEDRSDG